MQRERLRKSGREKRRKRRKRVKKRKGKKPAKRRRTVEQNEESDEEEEVQMQLNDSSEYSNEFDNLDLTACTYPFAEKAPEVRNFTFLLAKFFNL